MTARDVQPAPHWPLSRCSTMLADMNDPIRLPANARPPDAVTSPVNAEPIAALRLATEADLGDLLRWRNDPETRHFRNDPRLIEPDEHAAWLERRQRSESRVYIYAHAGRPVGNITLDVSAQRLRTGLDHCSGMARARHWQSDGYGSHQDDTPRSAPMVQDARRQYRVITVSRIMWISPARKRRRDAILGVTTCRVEMSKR